MWLEFARKKCVLIIGIIETRGKSDRLRSFSVNCAAEYTASTKLERQSISIRCSKSNSDDNKP